MEKERLPLQLSAAKEAFLPHETTYHHLSCKNFINVAGIL
jgi:hypothetical protein